VSFLPSLSGGGVGSSKLFQISRFKGSVVELLNKTDCGPHNTIRSSSCKNRGTRGVARSSFGRNKPKCLRTDHFFDVCFSKDNAQDCALLPVKLKPLAPSSLSAPGSCIA